MYLSPSTHPTTLKRMSTFVGTSSRHYLEVSCSDSIPQTRSTTSTRRGTFSILTDHTKIEHVLISLGLDQKTKPLSKRVSESFFDLSQRLAIEFSGSHYLRMITDCDVANHPLVFPWLTDTLLSLLKHHPNLDKPARKKILGSPARR